MHELPAEVLPPTQLVVEEPAGDEPTEDEGSPDTACTHRTLCVTGHHPRLRSSLPPRYPNWQRKRTQNPHSEGSNPSRGTR